jgi:hypothetical protein
VALRFKAGCSRLGPENGGKRGGKFSTLNNIETMARSSRKIKQILAVIGDQLFAISPVAEPH